MGYKFKTAEEVCKAVEDYKNKNLNYYLSDVIGTVETSNGISSWKNFTEGFLGIAYLGSSYEQKNVRIVLDLQNKLTELGYKVTVEKYTTRSGIFGKKFEKTKVTVSACCGENNENSSQK